MDFNFYMPVRVITGRHAVRENAAALASFGKKALLITGKSSAAKSGALQDVQAALKKQHIAWTQFDGISANPLLSACFAAGEAAKATAADFIIAIGGGSVLDAAKAAALFATNDFENPQDIYQKRFACAPLPLVLIGTTAGTGSEVSPCAVITVDDTMEKRSLVDETCFAKLALCDARYTCSLPRDITVSTALDAFAHALEGWFSKKKNTTVEVYATRCLPEIFEILRSLAGGAELTPQQRERMYYSSVLAGMILCIGTTFPHLLGYTLTDKRAVPHGQACAIFDKALLEWCIAHAPEETAAFCKCLGADVYEVLSVMDKLIDIPENVRFTKEEIERCSVPWTDDNPKLSNVCGSFHREDAVEIFTKKFLK